MGRGSAEEWREPATSCFSPAETCCCAFWCPCVIFGRAHHRLRGESMESFSKCNGPCWGFGLLSIVGCQWILQMMQRGEIRSHYNLKGGCCSDCLCACYCCCCDLVQQDKECKARNQENMHLMPNGPITQHPAPPGKMVYNYSEKPSAHSPATPAGGNPGYQHQPPQYDNHQHQHQHHHHPQQHQPYPPGGNYNGQPGYPNAPANAYQQMPHY